MKKLITLAFFTLMGLSELLLAAPTIHFEVCTKSGDSEVKASTRYMIFNVADKYFGMNLWDAETFTKRWMGTYGCSDALTYAKSARVLREMADHDFKMFFDEAEDFAKENADHFCLNRSIKEKIVELKLVAMSKRMDEEERQKFLVDEIIKTDFFDCPLPKGRRKSP